VAEAAVGESAVKAPVEAVVKSAVIVVGFVFVVVVM
jgi:hypothetical protein